MTRRWLLALAAMLSFAAPAVASAPAAPAVTIAYRASAPANRLWLVNAMAGDAHASTAAFRAYWKRSGYERPGDEAALDAFRRVRDRYDGEYLRDADVAMPVPVSPNGGDLRERFFAIFFSSATMAEAWGKAEALLTEDDAQTLKGVFAHFEPGFAAHWKRCGYLERYRAAFERFAVAQRLDATLAAAARFYGVPVATPLPVRMIFLFTPDGRQTFGRALGPNMVVEIPEGQRPVDQADVVVHELCHYFYDRGGLERDAAFVTGLFGSGDRHVGPAWGLLNEGLATAIGEGVATERFAPAAFAKTLARPNGWYNDAPIDAYAKALYPAVKAAIARGDTVRALRQPLLDAYGQALGTADDRPATYLASYVLIDRFTRRQGFARYFEQRPPRSVWHARVATAPGMLADYPAATVVAALTASDLEAVAAAPAAWGVTAAELAALRACPMAMLAKRRPMNGYLFMVTGADEAALDEAMARFGALGRFSEGVGSL